MKLQSFRKIILFFKGLMMLIGCGFSFRCEWKIEWVVASRRFSFYLCIAVKINIFEHLKLLKYLQYLQKKTHVHTAFCSHRPFLPLPILAPPSLLTSSTLAPPVLLYIWLRSLIPSVALGLSQSSYRNRSF